MSGHKGISEALLRDIANRLATDELAFIRKGQSFVRRTPLGLESLHVSIIAHSDDIDLTADVAVRFDALEELVHRNSALSAAEKRATFSLGAELGNISGTGQRRWTVRDPSDIEGAARDIVAAFHAIGLPYLAGISSFEKALEAIEAISPRSWLHSPIHASRCCRAVGLAHLLGRVTDVTRLAREYETFLQTANDPGLPKFRKFVASLA